MTNHQFFGPFSSYIADHIKLKQAVGYKYETDAIHLVRFSKFTAEKYPDATALTKEIVLDWCEKKRYESLANQHSRASIIRQLAIYMVNVGVHAYVLPKGYYPKEEKYVPYILY